jgi:hypothetical protein
VLNVSSWVGAMSKFDDLYCVDKGAIDRMLAEMAPRQLSPRNPGVRIITLYSGVVRREKLEACGAETVAMAGQGARKDECAGLIPLEVLEKLGWNFWTPTYVERVAAAIAANAVLRR